MSPTYDNGGFTVSDMQTPGAWGERPGAAQGPATGMPNMPPVSDPYGTRPPDVAKPASVVNAVRLMCLGAVVSAAGVAISLTTVGSMGDKIRTSARQSGHPVSDSTVHAAVAVGIGFAAVFGIIGVLLWLWMAWKNGQGRRWARIVATVLGGLNILGTLFGFFGGHAVTAAEITSIVNLIVAIVVLVLLYRPDANEYFQARSARRVVTGY